MSGYSYFRWVTPNAAAAFSNWRAWMHRGESVVPRNFYAEVDRGEVRAVVNEAWALAVEGLYRRELTANEIRALVIAHEICGGAPGQQRALGASKRQVEEYVSSFGCEVDRFDVLWLSPPKLPQAVPTKLPASAAQFRMAMPVERAQSPRWARR